MHFEIFQNIYGLICSGKCGKSIPWVVEHPFLVSGNVCGTNLSGIESDHHFTLAIMHILVYYVTWG